MPALLSTHLPVSTSLPESRRGYRRFVEDGMMGGESPWEKLSGQVVMGTETFVQWVKELLGDKKGIAEIPRKQRYVGRPTMDELFPTGAKLSRQERNRLIRLAHGTHGYTLKEISQGLGLHYTTVSKVISQ